MVPLQKNWPAGLLVFLLCGPSRSGEFDLLVDELAIVYYFDKFRVRDFLSAGVKTRRLKSDVEALPFTRSFARIEAW